MPQIQQPFTEPPTKDGSLDSYPNTRPMPLIADLPVTTEASLPPYSNGKPVTKPQPEPSQTAILHRTPWVPPVAVSGQGIYIDLEDGTRIIDGVGGAAVNCIGSGHLRVIEAMKDQLDKLLCTCDHMVPVYDPN